MIQWKMLQTRLELKRKNSKILYMSSLEFIIVTKTSVSSNTFIDDLIRLSRIKQELTLIN